MIETEVLEGEVVINGHIASDIYHSYDWGHTEGYEEGYKKGLADGYREAFWEFSRKRERR